jgi:hypothetical protein
MMLALIGVRFNLSRHLSLASRYLFKPYVQ